MYRNTTDSHAAPPRPEGVTIYRSGSPRPLSVADTTRPSTSRSHRPGRFLRTIAPVLLVLAGIAVMLYPQVTDLRYEFSQWRFERAAAAAQTRTPHAHLNDATANAAPAGDADGSSGVVLPEGTVARLEIPAIGLRAYVVEGTGSGALARGPGHYPGTPLPGEPGNAAIAGHRTMHGHVFGELDRLRPGDVIRTATGHTAATYEVAEVRVVLPSQTEIADPTDDDRLTLTTCHPKGSASRRLVVVATRAD